MTDICKFMEKSLMMLTGFFVLASDTSPVSAQKVSDDYVLVFSDEFNQPDGSRPDPAKWSCPPRLHATWSRWIADSRDVAFIKGGALVCRAIPNRGLPGDTARMLTGAVFTKGKFEFRYGKVEVRMRTNRTVGNFPAAWLRTWDTGRQAWHSEIDIVEMFGNKRESAHTAHSQLTVSNVRHGQRNVFTHKLNTTRWHVYGVEWTENSILWTVDGEKVGEYVKSADERLLAQGQWSFDFPLFLVLNQSVGDGGGYAHFVPQTGKTYETRFDWVRVYQKKTP